METRVELRELGPRAVSCGDAEKTCRVLTYPAPHKRTHSLSPTMAALDKLPYETLVQILSALSNPDLAQISLVSRHLCAVSKPLFYKAPCLAALRSNPQRPSLYLFLATLIRSPSQTLGTHAHSLTMRRDHTSRLDAVTYAGPGWFIGFQRPVGFHGTNSILLMHLLPSLRVLRINPPRDIASLSLSYFTHCIELLDNAPHNNPEIPTLKLQSLREFYCSYETGGGGISVRAVLALMMLPSINYLDVHVTEQHTLYSGRCIEETVRFSRVTRLRLSSDNVSPYSLVLLLTAPTALTHLSYSLEAYSHFDIPNFMDILSPFRPSLQHLHLDFTCVDIIPTREKDRIIGRLLWGWPVFQTLSCSAAALLGYGYMGQSPPLADVLSRTLRRLQILVDESWRYAKLVDIVVSLLGQKESAVPVLERVGIRSSWCHDEEAHAKLSGACAAAGVKLEEEDGFCW